MLTVAIPATYYLLLTTYHLLLTYSEQAAMAAKASSLLRRTHGEEVALLTEKLRQMQREISEGRHERLNLRGEATRREADLAVLSQEVLRLRG